MARSFLGAASGLFAAFVLVFGCSSRPPQPMSIGATPDAGAGEPPPPGEAGISITIDAGLIKPPPEFPACDPTRSVASDGPALLERDPAALAGFSLERVMARLIASAGSAASPLDKLQRLFDTLNTAELGAFADNIHCDDASNEAFANAWPVHCPRAEGVLATSGALVASDSEDSFVPVAIVNRFDQAPQNFPTCGEFRIVFAKRSGRTDARNRVLMIFEGVLPNPSRTMAGCIPVADFWARLPALPSAPERGARLEQFFFDGLPGFGPVIHAKNFGLESVNCRYESCGRIRLGLGMQEPWDFREFRLKKPATTGTGSEFYFAPVPLNDTPLPGLFDFYGIDPTLTDFRATLGVWSRAVARASSATEMRIDVGDLHVAGDSALAGPASPNFLERVRRSDSSSAIFSDIDQVLAQLPMTCPEGDPLTHESVLQRITALTCAGCHAPELLVSPSRSVGCALVWPSSLGQAHIDEHGTLSDGLVQTLLPQRADVLSTYLQACDLAAISSKFQPPTLQPCFVAGTPITMADGSLKPIEQITAGDRVLTFDTQRAELTEGTVTRTFVHPDSDDLVVVDGTLVATGNHPFYSGGKWVHANALVPGAELLTVTDTDPSGATRLETGSAAVRSLVHRDGTATTYNFEVAVHHAYFAGGILVHNKPI